MIPTRVAILAAGRGSRLSPLTDGTPKCLLPLGASSPLARILGAIDGHPAVGEVIVVTGHRAEEIGRSLGKMRLGVPVRCVFNPLYDSGNNICSAGLLAADCRGGFLLVNSDVVCDPTILRDALADPEESVLVVDPTRPPRSEAMKVKLAAGRLVAIGKPLEPAIADGEYIGIARFDAAGAEAFFGSIEAILERGGAGEWYEAAIAEAARRIPFRVRSTRGRAWIEIDDHHDLERAIREILPRIAESADRTADGDPV